LYNHQKEKQKVLAVPKKTVCMQSKLAQFRLSQEIPKKQGQQKEQHSAQAHSQTLCKSLSKSPSFPPQDPSSQISLLSFWDQ
jgi:hypothetical protein